MKDIKNWNIIRVLYVRVLRPLLYDKIEESKNKADDYVMYILDQLFDIETDTKNTNL